MSQIHEFIAQLAGYPLRVYWYRKEPNFGDQLNPVIFKYYGFSPIHSPRDKAEVIGLGSNLDKQPEDFKGYIIGTGLKFDIFKNFRNAKILAVRGEYTRERINARKDTTLGDPGLLVPYIYKKRTFKKYLLGIVPHFFDKNDVRVNKLLEKFQKNIHFIDVQQKPNRVVFEIDQCEYILSSSLHGMITADSLGIPNGWILLSDKVQGAGFKYLDHASAIGKDVSPNIISGDENISDLIKLTSNPPSQRINEVQQELDQVFREFSRVFRSQS